MSDIKKTPWNRCPEWLAYVEGFRHGAANLPAAGAKHGEQFKAWGDGWRAGKEAARKAQQEAAERFGCEMPGIVRLAGSAAGESP